MGNTSDFFVDFIIAQNLEKVKFWEGRTKPANGVSGGGGSEGREGEEGNREGRGEGRKSEKWGHVGKGVGVAVWRFQFLPFAQKATPVFTCQIM